MQFHDFERNFYYNYNFYYKYKYNWAQCEWHFAYQSLFIWAQLSAAERKSCAYFCLVLN